MSPDIYPVSNRSKTACIATAPNGWFAIPVGGQIGWISDSVSRIDLPPRIDS